MLKKARAGDSVRINNTVYTKQANGTWKSAFDTFLESTFISRMTGQKIDYLFDTAEKHEKPVKNAQEKTVKHEQKHQKAENTANLLDIEPKEMMEDVQEGQQTDN